MTVYGLTVEYAVGNATGDDAVTRLSTAFERGGDAISNFGEHVFPRLVPIFETAEGRQFDAQGTGPFAGHWAPLSSAYAQWKAKAAPGKPILELSGDLREALTRSSSPLASREWSANDFAFGTRGVEYASYHQVGTGRMPARPPFDFGEGFEEELTRATQLGLVAALRAARVDEVADVQP